MGHRAAHGRQGRHQLAELITLGSPSSSSRPAASAVAVGIPRPATATAQSGCPRRAKSLSRRTRGRPLSRRVVRTAGSRMEKGDAARDEKTGAEVSSGVLSGTDDYALGTGVDWSPFLVVLFWRPGAIAYTRNSPSARAKVAGIRMNMSPRAVSHSTIARARSTPTRGVARPATTMGIPMTRKVLGKRDAGAATKSAAPRTIRSAAATYKPVSVKRVATTTPRDPGATTPRAPRAATTRLKVNATIHMRPTEAPPPMSVEW